jgi:hypothetical protein
MNFVHLVVGLISDKATLYWNTNPWERQSRHGPDSRNAFALQSITMGKDTQHCFFHIFPIIYGPRSISWVKKQKKWGVSHKKKKKKTADQSMNSIPPPK